MGDQVVQAIKKHFIFPIPRRDLGLQVFSLLESLVTPESDWLWILWHLDLSSFSVTRTGQVSIDLIAENPIRTKQEKTKGGSLLLGQHHPGGSSPPWGAPAGGEATVQSQLLPRVETRGEQESDLTWTSSQSETSSSVQVLMATPRGQPGKGCAHARQYADLAFSLACRFCLEIRTTLLIRPSCRSSVLGGPRGLLKNSGEEIRELLERWVLPTLGNFLSFGVLFGISNEMIVAVGFFIFFVNSI